MMIGTEAAERDADKYEKEEAKKQKEEELRRAAEAAIDDELLASVASDSEVEEVVFGTAISPPRAIIMPPPAPPATAVSRPSTPEPGPSQKRVFELVYRTPDKPRAAPVAPQTPSTAITSEALILKTPPQEAPASTAPARLDGRPRREGKNSVYERAMVIERGRGRGGRGKGGRA
jgi:hypothetical protein